MTLRASKRRRYASSLAKTTDRRRERRSYPGPRVKISGGKEEKMKQRFNPLAIPGETHCGDCNAILTDKRGRVADAYFEIGGPRAGVRCAACHAKHTRPVKKEVAR